MCQSEIYDNHTQMTFTIDTLITCDSGTSCRRLYLAFFGITYDYYRDSFICNFDCYLVNDLIFALEFFVGNDIILFF